MNAIEFRNISKEFNGTLVLDDINISVKKGEIYALIGENGAGKSTLMSILFGMYQPSSGFIVIADNKTIIKDPKHASSIGIGMVHQHFKLISNFTNLENIILGSEFVKKGFLDKQSASSKIKIFQNKYGLNFDLNQKTENASVSVQQKIEIMKVLYKNAEIIIFDEPSAVLAPLEIKSLLETILELKKDGKTIIFISHKLAEVKKIADRASVIRAGKIVASFNSLKDIEISTLANAMVGSELVDIRNSENTWFFKEKSVIEFQKVSGTKLTEVSFKVRKGEILAFAGVEGNGQEDIEYLISGLQKAKSGKILFNSIENSFSNLKKKKNMDISYIPSDRHKHAIALDLDVKENLILTSQNSKNFFKSKFLRKEHSISNHCEMIIKKFNVVGALKGQSIIRSLSGGNQQKLVVGREVQKCQDFILVVQPTRGLDVGAINSIHDAILKLKKEKKAIILISYELDEVLSLADTVAVLNKGKIVYFESAQKMSREKIGLAMAGKIINEES